jgi:lipopolysaccharide export system permease protein
MRLTWYIIRLHIGPFIFGTSCVVFIFLLQFIFKFLNELVGKGLGYDVILKFIVYNLAWMLVLAVPMGMLVATLMAYGKLSGNNELTIMKSSGASALRAMVPSIVGGAAVFLALYLFNDRILPDANHRAFVLQNDITQLQPSFAVEPGRFTTLQGYSILARRVDHARNMMLDVTIYHQDASGDVMTVINAKEAHMEFNHDFTKLLMALSHGEVQQVNRRDPSIFRKFNFGSYQVTVPTSGYRFAQRDPSAISRSARTLDIDSMRTIADTAMAGSLRAAARIDTLLRNVVWAPESAPAPPSVNVREAASVALVQMATLRASLELESSTRSSELKRANQYLVEVHKKYSIPAACLVFVFVGAPLGIVVRRGNFGVSAAIALGFFVVYWACLILGEKLADRLLLSPFVAMWMANFVIGIIGLYLTILVSRETVFSFPRIRLHLSRTKDARADAPRSDRMTSFPPRPK